MSTRRSFLRLGTASAAAAPLLRVFAPGGAAHAAAGRAKRIVFLYSSNGTVKPNFWPDTDNHVEKPILAPLAPFKDQVTVVKGLGYAGFNIPHEMGTSKALTNYDAFDLRPAGIDKRQLAGPSLDEALSKTVGANSFRPVLRVGKNGGGGLRGALNFTADGQKINSIDTPASAFEFLFGAAAGATPAAMGSATSPPADTGKLAAWRDVRRSALDVLTADASALKSRLPGAQKGKMDAALDSIRSLEKSLGGPTSGGGAGVGMAVSAGAACAAPAQGPDDMDSAHQFARTITAAFACDLTRVVSWKLCSCADTNFLGIDFHNTSHQTGTPAADAKLTMIHSLFSSQIAFLVDLLHKTPDPAGGGSLLDTTVLYWANECAHGNHDPSPLPIVLIGSAGGAFKTGRQVVVDKTEGGKYGNLLVTLANAVGDAMTSFGDKRWSTGPLASLT